ncbi:signal peptide peptidase SppA [Halocatena halophila]|uniref:signal peptide peptidase SppA n=1 Tax=Halocatena halophila TaxID=2814576 RepID=UPI0038B308AA
MPAFDTVMSSDRRFTGVLRVGISLVGLGLGVALGWALFVSLPGRTTVFGVVLVILSGVLVGQLASRIAGGFLSTYNVAEVAVRGPITRDGVYGSMPTGSQTAGADAIVEQIERTDADRAVEALIVRLNTPGGEVVPSEDIRNAVSSFDGPTIAYATDTCASGGYWIASGCDSIWAREATLIGSIGVIGSRVNASELADRLGLSYEQFTAGEYKDAGMPLKSLDDDDRAYLQGLIDDYYDHFVDRVATGRDLDASAVRDTEARVYLGSDAIERGLVDRLGTRNVLLEELESELDRSPVVEEFTPGYGLRDRLQGGVMATAYALGAGLSGRYDDAFDIRL